MRKPIIAGNWKMHESVSEAIALATALKEQFHAEERVDVVLCPPFTDLYAVAGILEGTAIALGAQDVHWMPDGAYTGEISVRMLAGIGCRYAIVGHSERRRYFGETDEIVNQKARALLNAGLSPILCVGESLEKREQGVTHEVVRKQLLSSTRDFSGDELVSTVVAYEPVWAIGTGRTATPAQAQEVHAYLRQLLAERCGGTVADEVRIQYGGSVTPENVTALMAQADIDGALVGGASLKADAFARIIRFDR